jgi:signal transduction histidine kinase
MPYYRYLLFICLLSTELFALDANNNQIENLTAITRHQKQARGETPIAENFKPIISDQFSLSYCPKTHWFEVIVKNNSNKPVTRLLYIDSPINGELTFYDPSNLEVIKKTGSDFGKGLLDSRFHGLTLELKPNAKEKVLFSLQTVHQVNFKILATSPIIFSTENTRYSNTTHLYIGAVCALILFNFFLLLSSRDKLYLYYIVFVTFFALLVLNLRGFGQSIPFFGSNLSRNMLVLTAISIICFVEFVLRYLDVGKKYQKLKMILRLPQVFALIHLLIYGFADIELRTYMGNTIDLTIFLSFVAAITWLVRVWKDNPLAKFYLTSLLLMIFFTMLYFLMHLGILPPNEVFKNGPLIGNIAEMIAISLGIGYKFSIIDKKSQLAQRSAHEKIHYQRLVRVLSHDIANGLTLVNGFFSMLKKGNDNPEMMKKMDYSIKTVMKLTTLVRNQEKALKKEREIELVPVPFHYALKNAIELFSTQIKSKNLNLINKSEDLAGIKVLGEETIIQHNILSNILSNAIKFSNNGNDLIISCEVDKHNVHLSVINYGHVICPEIMTDILSVGVVDSHVGTEGEEGTGFGLKIIYDYMEIIQGQLFLKPYSDEKGQGTLAKLTFKRTN